jgi:hypothetical protein
MSDNKILRVSGEGLEKLKVVLSLCDNQKAIGYHAIKEQITFFWSNHEQATLFPSPLHLDRVAELASDWLATSAHYGPAPDHDGDNERGWLCFTQNWGHIEPFGWQAFIAIKPLWLMFGK